MCQFKDTSSEISSGPISHLLKALQKLPKLSEQSPLPDLSPEGHTTSPRCPPASSPKFLLRFLCFDCVTVKLVGLSYVPDFAHAVPYVWKVPALNCSLSRLLFNSRASC